MFANHPTIVLLASPDPKLLAAVEPLLAACNAHVQVALTLEAALASLTGPQTPVLALLDEALTGMDAELTIERLLMTGQSNDGDRFGPPSIVLISDSVSEKWLTCLAEGAIDDLIPRAAELAYWRVRIETALRNRQKSQELESFREAAAMDAQVDRVTGVYNRQAIVATLFRETDRVQRMKGVVSLILLDIDDFGHWNSRLGNDACDDLLFQVAGRLNRLLRSYDALGRPGMDEFLLVLPGCDASNAAVLASRIRAEVFSIPFHVGGQSIRLSSCVGIASSQGRSPVVVLREAELALSWARGSGPESTQWFEQHSSLRAEPIAADSAHVVERLLGIE